MFATRSELLEGAYAKAHREKFPVVFECNSDKVVVPFWLTLDEMRGWKGSDKFREFRAGGGRVKALRTAA